MKFSTQKFLTQPQSWQIFAVLIGGVVAISTSAILIRLATTTAQTNSLGFSLVVAASRLGIAALLLMPKWQSFQTSSSRAVWFSIGAGLLLPIHFATWISSLSYTSIAASTTLVTTTPIWVALISRIWFKEFIRANTIVGMTISLIGGVVISSTGASQIASNPLLGNGLALIGAWSASLYLLLGREAQRYGLTTGNHILIAYSVAAIVLLPMPLLFRTSYLHYPSLTYLWFGLMALIPQLIGHTSFNWAVNHISPILVTLAILLEPIGASILGYLVFQEMPSAQVWGGAIVLLVGIIISTIVPPPPK